VDNPFVEGRLLYPPATILVIFGASGDLTARKLVPGCYNLFKDGYLPESFSLVGVSRTPMTDEVFREKLKESVKKFSRSGFDETRWTEFSSRIFYQPLDATKESDFQFLKSRLEKIGGEALPNYLYYLAVSPSLFGEIAGKLKCAGLVDAGPKQTRIVVEKPFGYDLETAQDLAKSLYQSVKEEQLFRIDHYLGKETVQNILVFRFANGLFEPIWNRKYVDHIQISVAEDIGVENRGDYFDKAGIVRDFVQNHVFQMLSLLCIEPPNSLSDAEGIRNEKVKVLKSIKRLNPNLASRHIVRAQYGKGLIKGEPVCAYREEKGVAPGSETETFIAMSLEIDNWRWCGVPIFLRVGKRLAKRISEVSVHFKQAPLSLFKGRQVDNLEQNVLRIQVQPKEGISLRVNSKPPGPRLRVEPVDMDFSYHSSFGVASPEAYERLLLDAMRGEATLFTRQDEIEEAWRILDPVFQSFHELPLYFYEAGSWGPKEAAELLRPYGARWARL
jgi:glucose-6-phosphate 1-dehydrogenase